MINHKYQVGDVIVIGDGCANFRNNLPKGKVKGEIIKLEEERGMYTIYAYLVRFDNRLIYHVTEDEIIDAKERVIFT